MYWKLALKSLKPKPLITLKPLESLSWNYILVLAYLAINLQISNQIQSDDINQKFRIIFWQKFFHIFFQIWCFASTSGQTKHCSRFFRLKIYDNGNRRMYWKLALPNWWLTTLNPLVSLPWTYTIAAVYLTINRPFPNSDLMTSIKNSEEYLDKIFPHRIGNDICSENT